VATTIYFASPHGDGGMQVIVEEQPDEVARLFEDARGAVALTAKGGKIYVNPSTVAYFHAHDLDGR
jgi:hypothetical protein